MRTTIEPTDGRWEFDAPIPGSGDRSPPLGDGGGGAPQFGQADLSDCDREPIRTPGAIQPHGVLLAIEPNALRIVQVGGDTGRLLGLAAEELIGQSLEASLGHAVLLRMRSLVEHEQIFPKPLLVFEAELAGRNLDACAHLSSGLIILELEHRTEETSLGALGLLHQLIGAVDSAASPLILAQAISQAVQRVTGFDRVMVYKFLEDGSGHVIAERRRSDSVESFLDLHYPASDIPVQARALYLGNWIRCIPDARYAPSPLIPADGESPLDLSYSVLRSVSPIHLEYLGNMGVVASASLSIIIGGRLWGLIACHHHAPLFLGARLRSALELFAQLLSLHLRTCLDLELSTENARLGDVQAQIIRQMGVGGPLRLLHGGADLLDLIPAGGVAVVSKDAIDTAGAIPGVAQIRALTKWLDAAAPDGVLITDRLAEIFPAAAAYPDTGAGLLALSISSSHPEYILWFLPEVALTVTWAGDPAKQLTAGPLGARLTPRSSFEAWQETVRGRSRPWTDSEIEAATGLRRSILETAMHRSAARDREIALEQQNLLMAELDHRVKNTLATIQALVRVSSRSADDLGEFTHALELRLASMAKTQSLLTLSRWEGASLRALIEEELSPYRPSGSHKIVLRGDDLVLEPKAAMAVALALHELATNAVKHGCLSVADGVVSITWSKVRRAGGALLDIRWRESHGPVVAPPTHAGFGRTLLERVFAQDVQGRTWLDFKPDGVECLLELPYQRVVKCGGASTMAEDGVTTTLPESGPLLQGLHVLLVEDNALVALDVADILSESGAAVLGPYGRVSDALGPAEHATIELALLDIDVDGVPVWPIADRLRERHIPFVLGTGFSDPEMRPEMFRATPTIKKPYSPGALIQILAEVAGAGGGGEAPGG